MSARRAILAALVLALAAPATQAQVFTKVTDVTNPVVTQGGPAALYGGASWPDADGDGDIDLYVNGVGLFRNDGGGAFTRLPGAVPPQASSFANSWADVDNDGDLDVFVTGGAPNGSILYLNQGGMVFSPVYSGPIGDTWASRAWGCAFGDWDADGWIDLVTAAANGFGGIANPNRLFRNEGGVFAAVDSTPVTQGLAPYTVPSWSDYDLDGDPDLFIGAGPANGTTARDYIYVNRHESSPAWFTRLSTGPLGTDLQDGQVYNWIDFDNDGDLDCYLTNYSGPMGGMVNRLYRNDGGTFLSLSAAQAGVIVSDALPSLASVWQDFDNDADLDCLVTQDGALPNRFYRNNGAGFFNVITIPGLSVAGPHYSAASGDYDGDGLMDLFVSGDATTFGLYRNTTSNANGWLQVRLVATISNRAAIGARVRVYATVGGSPRRQMREISAQNTFNGMNALDAHFGLGDAAIVDSVVVEWPSGLRNRREGVAVNGVLTVMEEDLASVDDAGPAAGVALSAVRVTPNPASGPLRVAFTLAEAGDVEAELIDITGRRVEQRIVAGTAGENRLVLAPGVSLRAGVYFVRLRRAESEVTRRIVVQR